MRLCVCVFIRLWVKEKEEVGICSERKESGEDEDFGGFEAS